MCDIYDGLILQYRRENLKLLFWAVSVSALLLLETFCNSIIWKSKLSLNIQNHVCAYINSVFWAVYECKSHLDI